MKCPLDKSQLVLIEKKNAYAYHCDDCDGVFLHKKAVAYFKYNYEIDILSLLTHVDEKNDSPLVCPSCQDSMVLKEINGVEVDCCENCTGLWFDDTELENFSIEDYALPTKEDEIKNAMYWVFRFIRALMN